MFGSHDCNVKALEAALEVRVSVTGSGVSIAGAPEAVDLSARVLRELYDVAAEGYAISPADVTRAVDILSDDDATTLGEIMLDSVLVTSTHTQITAKTVNQRRYIDAIRNHDVVFAIGPAGTGKTYLAMAMAVGELLAGSYARIILTRPAVEAGEKLGFLPGDLAEKVNPYLRPLYDALFDMVGNEKGAQMIERGIVEVAPLAFMRGRTLSKAFVILDEGQNTSREQMKMFLTRLGWDSKAVITGDITQVDLAEGQTSGLRDAREVLSSITDLAFVYFDDRDVVRHPLVRRIISAYEKAENNSHGDDEPGGQG